MFNIVGFKEKFKSPINLSLSTLTKQKFVFEDGTKYDRSAGGCTATTAGGGRGGESDEEDGGGAHTVYDDEDDDLSD